ncbi:hypothetical protein CWI38_0888p0020 [Hamiltosporidium tvaerminnensis]|uniref:Helitron helicase-like domain-containing protein n=2 Tax=Hamiltosporidium TaxID=1176354 RepID=A0A4Q9L2U9_9MICR|nr:hypothetical protein CWI37_0978p0030 [Hamiltosporidium tvaerminnensis]TBU01734.1 hypothetical protein CWI36_1272p0020 [Hamiltosporidium magnivora]TBU03746.1 hypothetical protein CWI39_0913p0030 [Hamiltosporidium magnivora]TBU12124.1 hypothetical protein CWI38_0888p0020 [Hamiltosporidium tvaerminnensis]
MKKISSLMKSNLFAHAFKMMYEAEEAQKYLKPNIETQIQMAIVQNRKTDLRRYNAQRCNEVAVVFVSGDGEPPIDRDLLVHLRPEDTTIPETRRIEYRHRNLDALSYTLLFSYGEQTWGVNIKLYNARRKGVNAHKNVTLKQYYSYYLQLRDELDPLLRAGRLTQQYVVDAYCKAEVDDLNYALTHQKKLRAEK